MWVIFALLDPDPIRIRNSFHNCVSKFLPKFLQYSFNLEEEGGSGSEEEGEERQTAAGRQRHTSAAELRNILKEPFLGFLQPFF